MPGLIDLLLCYGFCFGLMNKVDFPRKIKLFNRLLSCSYCTGFHAGWISWALTRGVHGFEPTLSAASGALLWAFCSSAFCYLLDIGSQFVEARIGGSAAENEKL